MPILAKVDHLAPRMRLRQDVRDGEQLLLPAGWSLNPADVDFLRKRMPGALVPIEDPIIEGLVAAGGDTDTRLSNKTVSRLVDLLARAHKRFSARLTFQGVDLTGVHSTVHSVKEFLDDHPVLAKALIEQPGRDQELLVSHAAHVFYLSLVLGSAVRSAVADASKQVRLKRFFAKPIEIDLTPLALAALFMDLGMWPVQGVFEQKERLTKEQIKLIRAHTMVSAKALPPDADELLKLTVETHHENYDGTGYPHGIRGEEIHIYSRILRIADAFAAATEDRLYRGALSPVRALWEMCWGSYTSFYDPVLIKVFASLMQPFPIGSRLCLSDGREAVVVQYGRTSPFLPVVLIAFDEQGRELPPSRIVGPIRLDEQHTIKVRSFEGEDISDLYLGDTRFTAPSEAEFTTLFESVFAGRATAGAAG